MGLFDIFGGGDSNSTTTVNPWPKQAPFLEYGFGEAKRLYQQPGPHFFPFSTVAPFAPEQTQGMQLMAGRALGGAPEHFAARGNLTDTLSGAYLAPGNPYLSGVAARIGSEVMPRVAGMYSAAGRSPGGSGLFADTATRALTEALAPFAFQNFAAERENQLRAAALAPTTAGLDYADLDRLLRVGAMRQGQGQAEIDDARARFDHSQNLPHLKLQQYLGNISGQFGSQTTAPLYQNRAAGLLGGAATGAGIANMFGSDPWSLGTGAALGGLLGLFG